MLVSNMLSFIVQLNLLDTIHKKHAMLKMIAIKSRIPVEIDFNAK